MANSTNITKLPLNKWIKITNANCVFQNRSEANIQYTASDIDPEDDTDQFFVLKPLDKDTYTSNNDNLYCRRVDTQRAYIAWKNT